MEIFLFGTVLAAPADLSKLQEESVRIATSERQKIKIRKIQKKNQKIEKNLNSPPHTSPGQASRLSRTTPVRRMGVWFLGERGRSEVAAVGQRQWRLGDRCRVLLPPVLCFAALSLGRRLADSSQFLLAGTGWTICTDHLFWHPLASGAPTVAVGPHRASELGLREIIFFDRFGTRLLSDAVAVTLAGRRVACEYPR